MCYFFLQQFFWMGLTFLLTQHSELHWRIIPTVSSGRYVLSKQNCSSSE